MRMLSITEVMARTGLGRTTVWRWEKEGRFPKRRQLGPNRVGYLQEEIDEWIAARPLADQEPAEVAS